MTENSRCAVCLPIFDTERQKGVISGGLIAVIW